MEGKGGEEWTDDREQHKREERNVGQRKRVVTKVNELRGLCEQTRV